MTADAVIETERLRLRPHSSDDFAASHAMWSDERVVEYIGGVPSTRQQSWLRVLAAMGHWRTMPFGPYVVEERASGAFVGEVGLYHFKRDIEPSIDPFPEAGWAFVPAFYGRGYATEAVRAVLAWADVHVDTPRVVAIVSVGNLASLRVAEKCGFRVWEHTMFNGKPVVLFERPRSG